ncbi:MAG TPA: host-nuclease inhibitor Gam family protein [Allosphingosinicella sp.]
MTVRVPRTVGQATAMLERYAAITGELARAEERRSRLIVRANAAADVITAPLVTEAGAILLKLEGWWKTAGPDLAGKRKSIELGGCMIGSRASKPKLVHGFESDDKAVEALRGTRHGKQTTRLKYSLDRPATLKLLQLKGGTAEAIAELGFSIDQGERFFVQRAEQAGTIGAA